MHAPALDFNVDLCTALKSASRRLMPNSFRPLVRFYPLLGDKVVVRLKTAFSGFYSQPLICRI